MDEKVLFIIGISVGIVSIGLVIFMVLLIHFTRKLQGIQKRQRTRAAVPPADYFPRAAVWTTSSLNVTECIPEDIADHPSVIEELRNFPRYAEEYDNNGDDLSEGYDNNFNKMLDSVEINPSLAGSGEELPSNRSPDASSFAVIIPSAHRMLVIDSRPGAPDTPRRIVVGDVIVQRPGNTTHEHSEHFSEDTEGYMRPRLIVREA